MEQFFSEHYPDLVAKVGTIEGQFALERVMNAWRDAGSSAKNRDPGSSARMAEAVTAVLGNLGRAYVQAATDEMVRLNLTLDEYAQLWIQKYEPQLYLALQVAAAYVDWCYQATYLDPSEWMSVQMESMSEVQKKALQEWSLRTGRAMAQLIIEQGNSHTVRALRTVITDAKRAFGAPSGTPQNPFLVSCPNCRKLTPDERFCQHCGEPFYEEDLRAFPMVKSRFKRSPSVPIVLLLGSIFAAFFLGFVVGIVPGLLSGLVGWHKGVAIVLPIVWAIGYVSQRAKNYGDVDVITYGIATLGGLGVGASVWVFGSITS